MEPRRFSGKTVEEATDNALEALDVNLEDVEIVVVNPGRSGILGFGGEPAEIDVSLVDGHSFHGPVGSNTDESSNDRYGPDSDDDEYEDEDTPHHDEFSGHTVSDDRDVSDDYQADKVSEQDSGAISDHETSAISERREIQESSGQSESGSRPQRDSPSDPDPEVIEFASEVIDYFLASMNVVADTYIRDETDDGVPVFDIEGDDSGLLIGRRGETLQSLQYLVNMVVTNQLGRSAYVQIDIEGYKERRRETLGAVAQRTAERVADSGQSADLEPMPAYERRWVHMALANNSRVTTESNGEGANRFVVIYPATGNGSQGSSDVRRRRSRGNRRRRR